MIRLNKSHDTIHNNVTTTRRDLHLIQERIADDPSKSSLLLEESDTARKLENFLNEEEQFLMQKARVKWLTLGDANNSFFFNKVKSNWNHYKILTLENKDGVIVFGQDMVSEVAVDFFKNSIGAPSNLEPCNLDTMQCKTISPHQASMLTQPVNLDTIFKTLKGMKKNKAPGPDGFTVEFFLDSWEIVGVDFCRAIMHFFFTSSSMHPGGNLTSIALISRLVPLLI